MKNTWKYKANKSPEEIKKFGDKLVKQLVDNLNKAVAANEPKDGKTKKDKQVGVHN